MSDRLPKVHLRGSGHGRPELGPGAIWQGTPSCRVRGPARVTSTPEEVTCAWCRRKVTSRAERLREEDPS